MQDKKKLMLLFSHQITPIQELYARTSLEVTDIHSLPVQLRELWSRIPPEMESIELYLKPIQEWVVKNAVKKDYILIQGDFGATFLMITFAFEQGLFPVYATSVRKASEKILPDGSVKMEHVFQFCRFRQYGQ